LRAKGLELALPPSSAVLLKWEKVHSDPARRARR